MDKRALAQDIMDDLAETGIEDVSVRESDEGIVLSLDNIQFYPDSNEMLPGEREKLDKIADILLRHKERDILVGGHTALAGTAASRQELSLRRASSVAEYLINKRVRTPERVMVRGYGADRPVADNRTEEGRSRNRRVEITILEN